MLQTMGQLLPEVTWMVPGRFDVPPGVDPAIDGHPGVGRVQKFKPGQGEPHTAAYFTLTIERREHRHSVLFLHCTLQCCE